MADPKEGWHIYQVRETGEIYYESPGMVRSGNTMTVPLVDIVALILAEEKIKKAGKSRR